MKQQIETRQLRRNTCYTIKDRVLDETVLCPIRGPKMRCVALCAFYVEIKKETAMKGNKRVVHCNFVNKDIGIIF